MSNFFSISLSGALFISVIAVLRLLFKSRLPRTAFAALWVAAVFRLLCPVELPFAASIWSVFQEKVPPEKASAAAQLQMPVYVETAGKIAAESWSLSETIWLTVAVFLMACIAILYVRSLYESRKVSQLKDGVYVCKKIVSPRVCGIIHPKILLPEGISEELLPYILLHERIHILRRDNLWKLLALTAAAIHWFNPAVWLMVILLGRDLEVSCDEWVLSRLPEREKSSYALSLIAVAERCERRSPLTCGFSRNPLEERIKCIMTRKQSIIAVCAAAVMILGTTAVFATDAPADKKAEPAKKSAVTEQEVGGAGEEDINLKDAQRCTADEYEAYVAGELKEAKKLLQAGTMSRKDYDKYEKELKTSLKEVKAGSCMAFFAADENRAGKKTVVIASVVPLQTMLFSSIEEEKPAKGDKVESSAIEGADSSEMNVEIESEDVVQLKPGMRSDASAQSEADETDDR